MKQTVPFLAFLLLAFTSFSQKEKLLQKVLELQMPEGPGARGASVAFHPVLKRYYASIGGNAAHALGIFDQNGKKLSKENQTTLFDMRGFWWSPKLKTFCANGYSDNGWVAYELDSKGNPVAVTELFGGMHQPNEQSVGAFNPRTNDVYFLSGPDVLVYPVESGEEEGDPIHLHIGASAKGSEYDYDEETEIANTDYNPALVYTAKPKAEFGLLNFFDKQIELYDAATGYMTEKLKLPETAPVDEMMCFAYANGVYWLFDRSTRAWKGYK